MSIETIINHPFAPLIVLAAVCYAAGWQLNRILLKAPHHIARWRPLAVPGTSTLLGLGFGVAGTPGTGRWDLDLLLGLLVGFGPIAWASFLSGVRKARSAAAAVAQPDDASATTPDDGA